MNRVRLLHRLIAASALGIAVLFGPSPVRAEQTMAERILEAVVSATVAKPGQPGAYRIETDGPITAEPKGEQIVVTFPKARVVLDAKETLQLGTVLLTVTPRADRRYDFVAKMPKEMVMRDDSAKERSRIKFENYTLTGTWAAEIDGLVALNFKLGGLKAKNQAADNTVSLITLASATLNFSYEKDSQGFWSGHFKGESDRFSVDMPSDGESLLIGQIRAESETKNADWSGVQGTVERFGLDKLTPMAPLTPENQQALRKALEAVNWGDNRGVLALNDIAFLQNKNKVFSLDHTALRFSLDGKTPSGTLGLGISLDGLAVKNSELPPPLEPRQAVLDIALEHFPIGGLLASLFASASAETPNNEPDQGEMPDDGIVPRDANPADMLADPLIMEAMREAGAIRIDRFALNAAGSGLEAKGKLNFDMSAPSGVTGGLQVRLRGLDALLDFAKQQAQGGGAPDTDAGDGGEMAGVLFMLKGLGKPKTGSDGVVSYDYKIAFPKDAGPTVNGTPLDTLMGNGAPPSEEEPRS